MTISAAIVKQNLGNNSLHWYGLDLKYTDWFKLGVWSKSPLTEVLIELTDAALVFGLISTLWQNDTQNRVVAYDGSQSKQIQLSHYCTVGLALLETDISIRLITGAFVTSLHFLEKLSRLFRSQGQELRTRFQKVQRPLSIPEWKSKHVIMRALIASRTFPRSCFVSGRYLL